MIELPHGYNRMWYIANRIAEAGNDEGEIMHYCFVCEMWLSGPTNEVRVRDLGWLTGRRGIAYHCANGHELHFVGAVS